MLLKDEVWQAQYQTLMVRSAATPRVSNHEARIHPSRRGQAAAPQDEVSDPHGEECVFARLEP
jgi:hypothetical protein